MEMMSEYNYSVRGVSKRFSEFGYRCQKPLIRLFFKPIIFWLLDNLSVSENDNVYLICNKFLKI